MQFAGPALALALLLTACTPSPTTTAAASNTRSSTYTLPFQRSVINHGDEALLARVLAKLQAQRCLHVVAIGGSITCGMHSQAGWAQHTAPAGNASLAWPAFLAAGLNTLFPCESPNGTAGRHEVQNKCSSGAGTDTWVLHFSGKGRYEEDLIRGADLVVVDTSVNDVDSMRKRATQDGRDVRDLAHSVQQLTESLMLLLMHNLTHGGSAAAHLAAPKQQHAPPAPFADAWTASWSGIACIWLGTSSSGVWDGSWPRPGDAVHTHLPIAQHHGVPYVSVIDGFGPFRTPAAQRWFTDIFRSDSYVHLTKEGQALVAETLLEFLKTRFADWGLGAAARPWGPDPVGAAAGAAAAYVARPRVTLHTRDAELLLRSNPLRLPMQGGRPAAPVNTTARPCAGFAFGDDGHNKPGLLAYEAGATCSFLIPSRLVRRHARFWRLYVRSLKSYELMGVLSVKVWAVGCDGEGQGGGELLGSTEVDCLWEKRVSLSAVDEVELARPTADTAAEDAAPPCLLVSASVGQAAGRALNKIKLLEFVLI